MPDTNSPISELDVVTKLLRLHVNMMLSVTNTANCVVGGIIQLRSHERTLEKHDDVVLIYTNTILGCIKNTYYRAIDCLDTNVRSDDVDAILKQLDSALHLPYAAELSDITNQLSKSFKVSPMAPTVLDVLNTNITSYIADDIKSIFALIVFSIYAHETGVIINDIDAILSSIKKGIDIMWDPIGSNINDIFDCVSEHLTKITVDEDKLYKYLLDEGYDKIEATCEVQKRMRERVQKVIVKYNT